MATRFGELGNAKAQRGLGLLYVRGEEIPVNSVQAYKWFRIAERGGQPLPASFQSLAQSLSPLQVKIAEKFISDFFKERDAVPPATSANE